MTTTAPAAAATGVRGIVFHIQRASTSDGPGVRTTVFLKGCSNTCAWCHNPESIRRTPQLQVYLDRCIGCGRCVTVCPHDAQHLDETGRRYDRDQCIGCGLCAAECFAGGLEISGREMAVDEVVAEVVKDEPYYRHSGGGVTFSGGDPVLQTEFLRQLLIACRERGLHTAVDTAGHYPWARLESLLPHVDLVMYDLKAMDPDVHRRVIGNDGRVIRDNLRRLGASGVPFLVRTPVVGGVNDSETEIEAAARFLSPFDHLVHYELLPYHALGDAKLESLGLTPQPAFTTPDAERLQQLADVARRHLPRVLPPAAPSNGKASP